MNQVEEILSQLKDGDKLIYNLAANVIEQQQKRIDELVEENKRLKSYVERKLNRNLPTYEQLEAELCGKRDCNRPKLEGNVYCSYHYKINFG